MLLTESPNILQFRIMFSGKSRCKKKKKCLKMLFYHNPAVNANCPVTVNPEKYSTTNQQGANGNYCDRGQR